MLLKIFVRWLSYCVLGKAVLLPTVIVSAGRRNKKNALVFIHVFLMCTKQVPGTMLDAGDAVPWVRHTPCFPEGEITTWEAE